LAGKVGGGGGGGRRGRKGGDKTKTHQRDDAQKGREKGKNCVTQTKKNKYY